jgi:hypothetical protein
MASAAISMSGTSSLGRPGVCANSVAIATPCALSQLPLKPGPRLLMLWRNVL